LINVLRKLNRELRFSRLDLSCWDQVNKMYRLCIGYYKNLFK